MSIDLRVLQNATVICTTFIMQLLNVLWRFIYVNASLGFHKSVKLQELKTFGKLSLKHNI